MRTTLFFQVKIQRSEQNKEFDPLNPSRESSAAHAFEGDVSADQQKGSIPDNTNGGSSEAGSVQTRHDALTGQGAGEGTLAMANRTENSFRPLTPAGSFPSQTRSEPSTQGMPPRPNSVVATGTTVSSTSVQPGSQPPFQTAPPAHYTAFQPHQTDPSKSFGQMGQVGEANASVPLVAAGASNPLMPPAPSAQTLHRQSVPANGPPTVGPYGRHMTPMNIRSGGTINTPPPPLSGGVIPSIYPSSTVGGSDQLGISHPPVQPPPTVGQMPPRTSGPQGGQSSALNTSQPGTQPGSNVPHPFGSYPGGPVPPPPVPPPASSMVQPPRPLHPPQPLLHPPASSMFTPGGVPYPGQVGIGPAMSGGGGGGWPQKQPDPQMYFNPAGGQSSMYQAR
ncbi:hypothetical protein D915_009409 [Fasciola hepatica]|uniref:Uncharacterized protein n=1 Tax=Fasciola hepatica TaxID=6192 RepID=A0A4E0RF70_FASHE|nr:hypothetical protein D915_009409 [Fasciola hepatica]